MAWPEESSRLPCAPRSEAVRMPMRMIVWPYRRMAGALPLGSMSHERQFHDLRRYALAAHVDLELRSGLGLCFGNVRRADGRVDRRSDGAAAHDVHLFAVHVDIHAVPAHDLGLRDREADEPPRHPLELLLLQRRLAGERRPFVELHDEREAGLVGRDGVVDVVPVERQPRLEPQRVAGAEAARLGAARAGERVPQLLGVAGAAVDLEAVLAGVAGARYEHFRPRDLALRA